MNYYEKYLKYKNKYLKLNKSLEGGANKQRNQRSVTFSDSENEYLYELTPEEEELIQENENQIKLEKKKRLEAQRQFADSMGMKVIEVTGDGNCLFRSLSMARSNKQEEYNQIKNVILFEVRSNYEEFYKEFMVLDINGEKENLKKYVDRISKDGEWGDHLEIMAYVNLTGQTIIVHDSRGGETYEFNSRKVNDDRPPIHLVFTGSHYNLLVKKK